MLFESICISGKEFALVLSFSRFKEVLLYQNFCVFTGIKIKITLY